MRLKEEQQQLSRLMPILRQIAQGRRPNAQLRLKRQRRQDLLKKLRTAIHLHQELPEQEQNQAQVQVNQILQAIQVLQAAKQIREAAKQQEAHREEDNYFYILVTLNFIAILHENLTTIKPHES